MLGGANTHIWIVEMLMYQDELVNKGQVLEHLLCKQA